ncbi:hypothetical protein BDV95DRAFT_574920 [Massariosphaeria phaeospora]|uniref:Uncharacterized protein n=1 Tax=Massariosphaeria phaeospora TaxID=100035 RepID=A0A7C8IBL0_9PLEO|nr:hypothetical protein BDV95DRAFT_574920 [Massariosphaeria phaeospora]
MPITHRLFILATSLILLFTIAISLATSLQARAPSKKIIQVSIAQAQKLAHVDHDPSPNLGKGFSKGRINDTAFDRADVLSGTQTVGSGRGESTLYVSLTRTRRPAAAMTETQEGVIGQTHTPHASPSSIDEGFIGLAQTPTSASSTPTPHASPPAAPPASPILALTYDGPSGPKHCRGALLKNTVFPPPAAQYINGTCIDLPRDARCGVFLAGKGAGCEAQLFNMPACANTTRTFVNTVVFMPEERTVGALWRSMWVRCGIEAKEVAMLDPAILGDKLKTPGGGG